MSGNEMLRDRLRRASLGVVLTILIGLVLSFSRLGSGLARWSYDLLFPFAPKTLPHEAVIVKMDQESIEATGQKWPLWSRRLHARLLQQLARDGARLVVFDVFFFEETEEDQELVDAMKRVPTVLAGSLEPTSIPGAKGDKATPPRSRFREAAQGWGLPEYPVDSDSVVRWQARPVDKLRPSLPWVAAALAGVPVSRLERSAPDRLWLRYYGASEALPSISYHQALERAPGFFKDKLVVIGGGPRIRFPGENPEQFRTPYTRWGGGSTAGVEIQATALLNLVRHDWLERLSAFREALLIVLMGLATGLGFGLLPNRSIRLVGILAIAISAVLSVWAAWRFGVWYSWTSVAVGQIPCATLYAAWAARTRLGASALPARPSPESAGVAPEAVEAAPQPVRPLAAPDVTVPTTKRPTVVDLSQAAPPFPSRVADHELIRCVGRGAYGQVWLARSAIGLYHALKIVYRSEFERVEPYEREFWGIQKFMPISLNHPGLVRVLHVGRNDEQQYFYYIMELGDDTLHGQHIDPNAYSPKNLAKELQIRRRFRLGECVDLFVPLANALLYLHQQQLIHRDIKPSNIIFVSGSPKLADIGLVTDTTPRKGDATYVGTEGYIPPEGPGTRSADIYGLGKVIYEACTGQDRRLYPAWPDDLDSPESPFMAKLRDIIQRACQPNPQRRYPNMAALHTDLLQLQDELHGSS